MVIPLGDANPTRRPAVVTLALVVANLAAFVLWQPWSGDACTQQAFFLRYAAVPNELVEGVPLNAAEVAAGSLAGCRLGPITGKNVYAAVFTAMFLHAGWGHLLGNLLYLWVFGNNVEDRLGRLRFLVFYVATGLLATAVFTVPNAASVATLVGASGAIAGVLGAYLVIFPTARVTVAIPPLFFLPFRLPALVVLGSWFVLQVFADRVADMAGGGVAYLAHMAGFVAGALIVLVLGFRPERRPAQLPPRR